MLAFEQSAFRMAMAFNRLDHSQSSPKENSFVTHEELELRFHQYDKIKMFENKKHERKLLEIFTEQNERIMIVDDKSRPHCVFKFVDKFIRFFITVFRSNARVHSLETNFQTLEEEIQRVDLDCKQLYEGLMLNKPSTQEKVIKIF